MPTGRDNYPPDYEESFDDYTDDDNDVYGERTSSTYDDRTSSTYDDRTSSTYDDRTSSTYDERAPYNTQYSNEDYDDEPGDLYYGNEPPLTTGSYDETPLTGEDSHGLGGGSVRRRRAATRRETIERIAQEQQSDSFGVPGYGSPYSAARLSSAQTRRRPNLSRERPRATASRPRKSFMQRYKAVFTSLYIVLILVALSGFLYFFVVLVPGILGNGDGDGFFSRLPGIGGSGPNLLPDPPTTGPGTGLVIRPELTDITALVLGVNPLASSPTLTLLNTDTRNIHEFALEDGARLTSRIGTPIIFAEIGVGNMVDISYNPRTHEVVTLSKSRRTWERPSGQNVQINLENSTITRLNETFNFNSQTLVLYNGERFSVGQIAPIDHVTLLGIGDTAWLIQVDVAHGFLQFANKGLVTNGRVMIGALSIFHALDDIEGSLALPEGTHQVTVEGDNIEMFISHVTINQGQITSLNLDLATQRMATLYIQTNPTDAVVFINDVQTDISEPLEMDFGEAVIRVERPGFEVIEETVYITTPIVTAVFNLVEIVQDGTLVIFTTPSNAEVFIDNVFIGFSTLTHAIAPGTYHITMRMAGHTDVNYTLSVPSGEEVRRHFLLVESQLTAPWPATPPTTPPGVPPPALPTLPTLPEDTTPPEPPYDDEYADPPLPDLPDMGPP